jgi:hypothetical protein
MNTMKTYPSALSVLVIIVGSLLPGCGRGELGVLAPTAFTVGGTVTGLDGTVVLQLNGGADLSISENGPFTFSIDLADEATYEVTVLSQPTSQTLDMTNTSGAIGGTSVTDVALALEDLSWVHPASLSDNISPDGSGAYNQRVAMSDNEEAVIVWFQASGGTYQIFKSDYRGSAWTHPPTLSSHISPAGQWCSYPEPAIDENGNSLIVWYEQDGSDFQIFKSEYRGGTWTHPSGLTDNISPDGEHASAPQVAMGNNGDAVIVWFQYDGTINQVFKSEYREGAWVHPADLSDTINPDGKRAYYPQVAMDDSGNTIAVWYQSDGMSDQVFKSEYRNGSWTHPADLSDNINPAGQSAHIVRVAMDNNGNALIVWPQSDGSKSQIFMSEYRNGSWTHPADLSDNISPDGGDAYVPRVAMDDNGAAVIVWHQHDGSTYQIFMSEYRNGSWTHPADLSDNISPDGSDAQYAQLTLSDHGNAVIAWHQNEGTLFAIYKSEYNDGAWTHPAGLASYFNPPGQDARYARLASDGSGNVILLWNGHDGSDYQIFMSEYR